MNTFSILILTFFLLSAYSNSEENQAKLFLKYINSRLVERRRKTALAEWNYNIDATEPKQEILKTVLEEARNEHVEDWHEIKKLNHSKILDKGILRQLKLFLNIGYDALPPDRYLELQNTLSNLTDAYASARICSLLKPARCSLALEPDIKNIMAQSKDPDELKHVWVEWRNAVGSNIKGLYQKYVQLTNEAAHANGFKDATEMLSSHYEVKNMQDNMHKLWDNIKPLYVQLHAYIRYHLRKNYGNIVPKNGPIPAHLLGNIWASTWEVLSNETLPHTERKPFDISRELDKQFYTPTLLYKTAEDFFRSINLFNMPTKFWEKSVLEKVPRYPKMKCTPFSWDMYEENDYRISACTRVSHSDFFMVHRKMALIEYFMAFRNQPPIFRKDPADKTFMEGFAGLIELFVISLKYLHKLELVKDEDPHPYDVINHLFLNSLTSIAYLPFAYAADIWRFGVFSGKIQPDHYNCEWWKLIHDYQGIEPPVDRSEENFDPVSKLDFTSNTLNIKYFLSLVLQHQIHAVICKEVGQYNRLSPHESIFSCNIYNKPAAGKLLKDMMEAGNSQPWQNLLENLMGHKDFNANAMIEYYSPLMNWLTTENKKNHAHIGWSAATKVCKAKVILE